jgi:hypothetical protein
MSLSKYPELLDLFQVKRDAAFDGDPNGDDVMADDINALQDAISAIESTLGIQPQGSKVSVGERISILEGSATLRAPSFLMYLGEADKINGATSIDEAVGHFVKFEHIVFGNNADDITSASHDTTQNIITNIKGNRDIKIYGYIDSGVKTVNLSVSQIQVKIKAWKDMGVDGIYLDNFGYESGVSRDRQNQILDSIHQYGMVAIMQALDSEKLLTDAFDTDMNPNWVPPNIQKGDIYHYQQFAVDTSTQDIYTDTYALVQKMNSLYYHRLALGVRVFATPYIASSVDSTLAQQYYEWAHVAALATSVDAFYPVNEGNGQISNSFASYNWTPVVGNWYVNRPVISIDTQTNLFTRETAFGRIILNNADHTYRYEGIYIPYEMLRINANTIDGSLLIDGTIEDKKIKNYDGGRLIDAINANLDTTKKINMKQIWDFSYSDISGDVPSDVLTANVIEAINANIGKAVIDEAVIGDLSATHITSGTIDAERISASVVNAIALYAQSMTVGSAKIDSAVIGDLTVDNMQANVIKAVNASIENAVIDSAKISDLNADKITAGDIAADRIKVNVVNAINAYADNLVAGQAVIKNAAIGQLAVDNMKASVIAAVNASIETATIDKAKISELDATHIQAAVIDAINANISGVAKINGGIIQDATIGGAQIDEGSITDAHVLNLDAGKLVSGTIDTAKITIQGDNGMLRFSGNRIQVFDNSTLDNSYFERVSIGDINGDGTTYGFQVRGSDGTTVLYDERGVYNEGITDGAITNPKIGDDEVDGRVIAAEAITAKHVSADSVVARLLSASKIMAQDIQVGTITAGSGLIADAAIGTAQIADASITDAKIDSLNANKINAGKILAQYVEIGSDTTFASGYDPAAVNSGIRSDLRLTAPLGTHITLDSNGITAHSTSVTGAYARLDYRGLYISGGAIIIDGGLTSDNLSPDVQNSIDTSSQYVIDVNSDTMITPSEKILLQQNWDEWQAENTSLMGQADYYWPDNTTAPIEKTDYITSYGELHDYLTALPDINNLQPILYPDNMNKNSEVNPDDYRNKLTNFKVCKYELAEKIATTAKDLADAAQKNIDEVENNIVYNLVITSSQGVIFKNGQISTILEAHVYHGINEVTDQFDASKFKWTRVSVDMEGDAAWNTSHSGGTKSVTITPQDVYIKATFNCELD